MTELQVASEQELDPAPTNGEEERLVLTDAQQNAHDKVIQWYRDNETQAFRFAGYAGTGKTTALKQIVESLYEEVHGDITVCAFTNKAASVLRSKGIADAMTVHSSLYIPAELALKELIKRVQEKIGELQEAEIPDLRHIANLTRQKEKLQKQLEIAKETKTPETEIVFDVNPDCAVANSALVVIDEASMINMKIAKDMLEANPNVRILMVGDGAQLPPVEGKSPFLSRNPDVELDEIIRVERNSTILCELANYIRKHQATDIPLHFFDDEVIFKHPGLRTIDSGSVDKFICGTNAVRHNINSAIRAIDGKSGEEFIYPVVGETLVGLANNKDERIFNGVLYKLEEIESVNDIDLRVVVREQDGMLRRTRINRRRFRELFEHGAVYLKDQRAYVGDFDYGYCLTVHKSQGSEYPRLGLVDDSRWMARRDRAMRCRWLYTAVTRAKRSLHYTDRFAGQKPGGTQHNLF